jgi:hypothetical protein
MTEELERLKRLEKANFGHKAITGKVIDFCEAQGGLQRVKQYHKQFVIRPDLIYVYLEAKPVRFLVFEIKPSYITLDELARGIGECVAHFTSSYFKPVESWLVIYQETFQEYQRLLLGTPYLEWLGILTYGINMRITKKPGGKMPLPEDSIEAKEFFPKPPRLD